MPSALVLSLDFRPFPERFIRLGGHLCRLKAMCQHGEFEALAEKYCRLGKIQRSGAMKVFREYGEKFSTLNFSGEALKVLAYAPDPQAALEEDGSTQRNCSGGWRFMKSLKRGTAKEYLP